MTKLQFRVLYRQFLFRMVDLELLSASAQGDISKLLGQFAGLLIFFSAACSFGSLIFDRSKLGPAQLQSALWGMEHFFISTTLLVVGMFAVLSWDSTFPDRRDVLVLAPLPIRARTLFFAKLAAAASALSLTVVALHCLAGLGWPFHFMPKGGNAFRSLAAYWITMFAAGAFNFCCVLGVQGLAAQLLPRRHFLRLSAFLQMAAFCWFVSSYFLEPTIVTPIAFAAPQNQRALEWLPSYWFLGFFHQLNGSMHPAFIALARRAWIGLAAAFGGTAVAYALSYFRTLKKIVEEPDIVPGSGGVHWLPSFGNSLETGVVQFSIRTLARSRQHRVMLAFFLGIGFALLVFVLKNPGPKEASLRAELPLLFTTVAVMCITVVGTRVVFSMPISLRANWIFRVTQVSGVREYMAAIRRPLFVLGVAPVLILSASLLFSMWPWQLAADHLVVLGLLGAIVAYVCLAAFRKIPFTCSYLPGKSYLHMAFLTAMFLMLFIIRGVVFESVALQNSTLYAIMVTVLAIAAVAARWWAVSRANEEDAVVQFEEVQAPILQTLGLNRDGVVTTEAASAQNGHAC
jgi:hypothetical protein